MKDQFENLMKVADQFNQWADYVATNAINKGFRTENHPPTRENISVFSTNLHGEVSEFWEAFRAGKLKKPCDKAAKMEALGLEPLTCEEEELADIIIRALDTARANNVDVARAIVIKHLYNSQREPLHGGKLA